MDVNQLIAKAGGPSAIANASREAGSPLTVWAIQKWKARNSIPDEHWGLLHRLTGISISEIYQIARQKAAA